MLMMVGQLGHCAPDRLMVPAPRRWSWARRCAVLPPTCGTSGSMPKTTPVRSALGVTVSSTRFVSFFASHLVLSSGSVARQPLHGTVRAHR